MLSWRYYSPPKIYPVTFSEEISLRPGSLLIYGPAKHLAKCFHIFNIISSKLYPLAAVLGVLLNWSRLKFNWYAQHKHIAAWGVLGHAPPGKLDSWRLLLKPFMVFIIGVNLSKPTQHDCIVHVCVFAYLLACLFGPTTYQCHSVQCHPHKVVPPDRHFSPVNNVPPQ